MKNCFRYFLILTLGVLCFSCSEDLDLIEENAPSIKSNSLTKHCNTEEYMHQLLLDPEYKKSHEERIQNFKIIQEKGLSKALCATPTIIPVAIHYQGINNPNQTCLIDLAKRQVDILNNDFQGKNSDINKWNNNASSSFPGVSLGETCVKFCIADQNHPSGYGLSNGELAITVNATQGDQVNKWSGYLNIYVQFGTGALGYAPYGGAGNGDGVVIEASAFGANASCGSVSPESPYNLGRTTTHEVGHYFLLDHIWGNGCGVDDEVADTPEQASDYGGCPSIGQSSCGSRDLHMNYMDYTDDACMYMFTNGQSSRMENYINANLRNLINNASSVCSEAAQDGGGDDNDGPGDDTSCANPALINAVDITETSIYFDWADISNAVQYRIGLRKQGTTQWTNQNVTISQANYTNLESGTSYEYRIRTQCPSGWVSWSGISSINTTENNGGNACDTPADVQASNVSSTAASISWSTANDAIRYQLRYRVQGISTWMRINSNSPNVNLTNLLPNTSYQYKMRTRCQSGWTSYTSVQTFKTTVQNGNDGNDDTSSSTVTVEVKLDDYGSETTWYIVDEQDRIIAEGGPYGDFRAGQVKRKNVDIESGCYTFVVEDYYGDGICCDYGNGSARIVDANGGIIAASDGQFGFYHEIPFCKGSGSFRLGQQKRDIKRSDLPLKR